MASPEAFAAYVSARANGLSATAAARRAGIDPRTALRFERRQPGAGLFWLRARQQGAALAREAEMSA